MGEKKGDGEAEMGEEEETEAATLIWNRFLRAPPSHCDEMRLPSSDKWPSILRNLCLIAHLAVHSLRLHQHPLKPRHNLVVAAHQTPLGPVRQTLLIPSNLLLFRILPTSAPRSVPDLFATVL